MPMMVESCIVIGLFYLKDERVAGGLAVKEFKEEDKSIVLPPTNPGMPMYINSPGFTVVLNQNSLKVLVPAQRVSRKTNFKFDAVTVYMEVNTSASDTINYE